MSLNQGKMLKIGNFIIRIFELLNKYCILMAYIPFYTWFGLESKDKGTTKMYLFQIHIELCYSANNSNHFRADFEG